MVSIIVPIYNVEPYLQRCVESLLRQTYRDREIILVDDGSPDGCPQMCDEFARANAEIRVIHKQNGGLSSARLAGFREARGKYVLFVDSDDYIEPTMAEEMVRAIEERDADMAICGYSVVRVDGKWPVRLPYETDVLQGANEIRKNYVLPLLGDDGIGPNIPGFVCLRLYRRELLGEEMFQSERKFFLEDHILNLLYADRLRSIAVVNKPLYNYCVNYASLSNCYRKNKWGMDAALMEWYRAYVAERHITGAEQRLANFRRSGVAGAADNAVKTGSYKKFKEEMCELFGRDDYRRALSETRVRFAADSQNVTVALLKLRWLRVLYKIRKRRIEKAQTK